MGFFNVIQKGQKPNFGLASNHNTIDLAVKADFLVFKEIIGHQNLSTSELSVLAFKWKLRKKSFSDATPRNFISTGVFAIHFEVISIATTITVN